MKQSKIILGVCGGSGSGKTNVCDILSSLGAYVIDGDKIARTITSAGSPALTDIKNRLGDEYINADGTLNRRFLSEAVFKDANKLNIINSITHPRILDYVKNEIINSASNLVVLDGALAHKVPFCNLCDYMLFVETKKEIRAERIVKRDMISKARAMERINSQPSDEEYKKASDFTISGNIPESEQRELLCNILRNISR